MGHYALLVPAYVGHLNPMTVLGRGLQRRGHRITAIAPLAAEAAVRQAGLEYIPIAAKQFPAGDHARARQCADQLQCIEGPKLAAELIERAFTRAGTPALPS